ncbi:MAG: CbtB-domain containing protein [Alphaproteobacteria bacterium]|nr:CbtB-domain containing protein [Alphaproteobacteria bacterium]
MLAKIFSSADLHRDRLTARASSGLAAILLGAFLLLGTGFAQPNLLHDAAHDTRHGFSFPCH